MREYYKRTLLGKSTVSNESIHLPKRVRENYNLKKGDQLYFYPPDVDFPDDKLPNMLAVLIVRATTSVTT